MEKLLASYKHGLALYTLAENRTFNFEPKLKIVIVDAAKFGHIDSGTVLSRDRVTSIITIALDQIAGPIPDVDQHAVEISQPRFKSHCEANLACYHLLNPQIQISTRYLATTKLACYSCGHFLRLLSRFSSQIFHVKGSHNGITPWTFPNMSSLDILKEVVAAGMNSLNMNILAEFVRLPPSEWKRVRTGSESTIASSLEFNPDETSGMLGTI